MHFRLLSLCFLLVSNFAYSAGRSPAVEDFVGIEVEQVEATPHGSEPLYNLEKDLSKIETARKDKPIDVAAPNYKPAQENNWSPTAIIGLIILLGLPLIIWMLVMNRLRQKASQENASNIEVLEKYRQERELARNKENEIKKAS